MRRIGDAVNGTEGTPIEALLSSLPSRAAHQPRYARDPISVPAIRTWCDAMGERNPAFCADSGVELAPPATLQLWTFPGLLPGGALDAGPALPGDLDAEVRAELSRHGYSATLATTTDQEFLRDLRPGDLLSVRDRFTTVSAEKRTALGPGFFLTTEADYATGDGALVGRITLTVLHFRPHPPEALGSPIPAPFDGPKAVPGRRARLSRGTSLSIVRIPITPTLVIAGALATRDFYPVHHDRDFARAHGNPDILLNVLTTNGLLARVVGEWTGGATLRRLRTRLRGSAYAHQVLEVRGSVSALAPGRAEITISAATEGGPHADATAVVQLDDPAG
jgi:acyl dehydratase